ncbi:MAG: hypothetical protein HQ466_00410, partial [Cryomorphaceae bacterium]|nr:hypothetical protein [Cryomorphaceae bacterium]
MIEPKKYLGLTKPELAKIFILLSIFAAGVAVAFRIMSPERQLPILNPSDLNPAIVADSMESVGMNHVVADFELLDQTRTRRSAADVEGKVRVVSYFFTT